MVTPLPPWPSKPCGHTRQALATLWQAGDIRGWFGLAMKPRHLMEHYAKHRTNIKVQNDTFTHFTNRACQSFWDNEKGCKPSAYLDAFMTL